ncbi:DNA polymerase/3'-5' exonuclease PolX [Catellatospora bangladeshensis]|uniref:DNA polymerase beta n=1 Tax=Catellatospora bangladeshensis TaxID=310355 RepID=A0A8J3JFR6_9ACTN|nr:DNA polymerase/3'-5' exonuclease PolX [Catellatospora bangladeshensis]GIF84107.1 DNA polymerase/3'-5' exonuclease PolX [Catellatospora bangladeshensis]
MARPNEVVAAALQEYADLISITGGDPFRARTYEKAARGVAGHSADVATLDLKGLAQIPGIGKSTAEKIVELLGTGRMAALEELRAKVPAGVRELMAIPGLGPAKAMTLHRELGIASVDELVVAIEAGRLSGLRGFGAKTAANILHGIEVLRHSGGRVLISTALAVAEEIVAALSALPGCERCTYAGSLRRGRDSIGDVDILAASREPEPIMAAFAELPLVGEVIARGPAKTSIRTNDGLQVDLRVVPHESWGAAMQYFTGSKEHNIRVREIAVRKGLKLSEYGLFRAEDDELVVSATEEEVYGRLGLPWIPPTLREDRGEVAAAREGRLPRLVTEADIRGDLHTHTDLTDGVSTLEEMLAAARKRGHRYYAVTDHAKNMPMQRMTDAKMLAQRRRLRELADQGRMALLHGTELNIDPDGGVDWDAGFLAGFDICVASIHSHFTQTPAELTNRLVKACENPYVNIIGHPTTRLIGRRAPIEPDWDAVFDAAAATGTALEVNAFPDRLDLNDELIMRARERGVKFAIDSDAHSTVHLDVLRFGIGVAQRGWLTPADVINTWTLPKLRSFIAAKRRAA